MENYSLDHKKTMNEMTQLKNNEILAIAQLEKYKRHKKVQFQDTDGNQLKIDE